MTPALPNGPELLRREILQEAHRQAEEIGSAARETAGRHSAKAAQEAAQARQDKLATAQTEANRRREAILATVSIEAHRIQLARMEELLEQLHAEVRQRIETGDGVDQFLALARLATHAVDSMAGDRFVMRLSPGDGERWGERLAQEVRRASRSGIDLRLEENPETKEGTCILLDEEGHQTWEIGLQARLERLWPELRRQVAARVGFVEAPRHEEREV